MTAEELYSMKIGDKKSDDTKIVERVPGGWNYIYIFKGKFTSVHVPYSAKEKPKKPQQTSIINSLTLEDRKEQFKISVGSVCKDKGYNLEAVGKPFFIYWSEHGEGDKKMRFEKEKTFGISSRILIFAKDENKTIEQGVTPKDRM
jgi:hypothetical protein